MHDLCSNGREGTPCNIWIILVMGCFFECSRRILESKALSLNLDIEIDCTG